MRARLRNRLSSILPAVLLVASVTPLRAQDAGAPPEIPFPAIHRLAWTGKSFVGAGDGGIHASTDGITWKELRAPGDALYDVVADGGFVVVVGDGLRFHARTDADELALVEHRASGVRFVDLASASGRFVALDMHGRIHSGPADGEWKSAPIAAAFDDPRSIAFGDGTWVAAGRMQSEPALFTARDPLAEWTRVPLPSTTGRIDVVAYANGAFTAIADEGRFLVSRDAVTWTESVSEVLAGEGVVDELVYANDQLVAFGWHTHLQNADGTWETLRRAESTFVACPVVRDGRLLVVKGGATMELVPIEQISAEADEEMAAWAAAERPLFEILAEAPERSTAFGGADVRRLAIGGDAIWAATSNGLFRSVDARDWQPFGGARGPIDAVAVALGDVVIATNGVLSRTSIEDARFVPVADVATPVRDVRGAGGTFAALGDGARLWVDVGSGWKLVAVPDATAITGIEVGDFGPCTFLYETAAGTRVGFANDTESWSSWTRLRGIRGARSTTSKFASSELGPGLVVGELGEDHDAWRFADIGRLGALIEGSDYANWLATSSGLVARVDAAGLVPIHRAEGAEFSTLVDARSSIVAAGKGGVVVIAPKHVDDANAAPLTGEAIDLVRTDLPLPTGVALHVHRSDSGDEARNVESDAAGIRAVVGDGRLARWTERGWTDVVHPFLSYGRADFALFDGGLVAVRATEVLETKHGDRDAPVTSWNYARGAEPAQFRRVHHGSEGFLVLSAKSAVGVGDAISALAPRVIEPDAELHDAAWGAGKWVLVGGRAGDTAGIWSGTTVDRWRVAALGARAGSLRAVIHDGARFVAVGDGGTIATSGDGARWRLLEVVGRPALRAIAFGAGRYAATSDAGVLVSDDLLTWRELPRDPQFTFEHVAGDADALWAIGKHAALSLRAPASAWTGQPALATTAIEIAPPGRALAEGARLFETTPMPLRRLFTGDGDVLGLTDAGEVVLWNGERFEPDARFPVEGLLDAGLALGTPRNYVAQASPAVQRVYTGDGRWLFLYDDHHAADTHDATTFARLPLTAGFEPRDAARGAGIWVIVGEQGGAGAVVRTSYPESFDASRSTSTQPLAAVASDGTRFVAVGRGGVALTSTDGATWTRSTLPGAPDLVDVAFGAGRWAAVTAAGKVLVSDDATTWRSLAIAARAPSAGEIAIRHAAGTPDVLVLAGDAATVVWGEKKEIGTPPADPATLVARVTELDTRTIARGEAILDVFWDGKRFVARSHYLLFESRDGASFTPCASFQDWIRTARVFDGALWVRTDDEIVSAPIGTDAFTSRTRTADARNAPSAASADRIAFVDEHETIVFAAGAASSPTRAPAPPLTEPTSFAHGDGRWVVSGRSTSSKSPAIAVSRDLATWKVVDLADLESPLQDVRFSNGKFVDWHGRTSTIVSSTDGETWDVREIGGIGSSAQLAHGDGRFHLVTNTSLLVFEDAVIWRALPVAVGTGLEKAHVAFGQLYVARAQSERIGLTHGVLTRVPLPTSDAIAAATPVKTAPFAGFARHVAAWDAKLASNASQSDRLVASALLFGAWREHHPTHTQDELLAFVDGMYERLLGYEVDDTTLWYWPNQLEEFSDAARDALLATQPANVSALWRQIQDDIVRNYHDRPKRVQSKSNPPRPQKSEAEWDIDALRVRAANGRAAACFDLGWAYREGAGVPVDTAAENYWRRRARKAGLTFLEGERESEEQRFAAWKHLADQGSTVAQRFVAERYKTGSGVEADVEAAARWYQLAVGGGDRVAYVELALAYRYGQGLRRDQAASLRLLTTAAEAGYSRAWAELGLANEMGVGVAFDLAKAAEHFRKAADLGNNWARRRLADMHLAGQGVARDEQRARDLLQASADVGDEAARTTLAELAAGKHTPRALAKYTPPRRQPADFDLAARRARAEIGDAGACFDMANAHSLGLGVEPDDAASDAWMKKAFAHGWKDAPESVAAAESWRLAAEQGSIHARYRYALCLRDGISVPLDHAGANRELERALAEGYWPAAVERALQHRRGRGGPVDLAAAIAMLERGATLGHAGSIYELARSHESAAGVRRDLAEAARSYARAGELGHTLALRSLARFHLAGHGVAVDKDRALALVRKAVELEDPQAPAFLAEIESGTYLPSRLDRYVPTYPSRPAFDVAARRALAEAGDAAACYDLAYAHWQGLGVERDSKGGNAWLARAKERNWRLPEEWDGEEEHAASWRVLADQGSLVGTYNLATRLRDGLGVARDVDASIALFAKAADGGHADALAEIGLIHEFGRGATAVSLPAAVAAYQRAAALGSTFAQAKLGYFHDVGVGVARDVAESARWLIAAADGGNATAAANLAAMLVLGKGVAADPRAAAGRYLQVAGFANVPCEPVEALADLRAELAAGRTGVLGTLAILVKRGFGTAVDHDEAYALALASEHLDMRVYSFSWFETNLAARPAAIRRAADVLHTVLVDELDAMDPGSGDAVFGGIFATAANRETSEIARALRALAGGAATAEIYASLAQAPEPLAVEGLAELHAAVTATTFPVGQAWHLRLAGITEQPADDAQAESLFVREITSAVDANDTAAELRRTTLRRLQAARLFYGVGVAENRASALAWLMLDARPGDDLTDVHFVTGVLAPEQLPLADFEYSVLLAR